MSDLQGGLARQAGKLSTLWSHPRATVVTVNDSRLLLGFFAGSLALAALDAYDVDRIPVQWIVQLGTILAAGYVAYKYRLPKPIGVRFLWALLVWSAAVTVLNSWFGHYASLMPSGATTPYAIFVLLRLLSLVFYIACLYLTYWLIDQGFGPQLVSTAVLVGTIVALAAMYIYMAQVYGLPEPPRSRMGTSGAAQAVRFTYDFHRATGTFREPSLLAAWLMVPLMLCFVVRTRLKYVAAVLIAGTILLTGSLSAILAIAVGVGVSASAALTFGTIRLRTLLPVIGIGTMVLILSIAIFYAFAVSNSSQGVNLLGTLGNRLLSIVKGGLGQSDRNVVYGYVIHTVPPILGTGLGNANLLFTHDVKGGVVASFISLYLNALYSSGLVGFGLLCGYLVTPVWRSLRSVVSRTSRRMLLLFAPYVAWLIVFAVAMEELTFMFALLCAFLSYELSQRDSRSSLIRERVPFQRFLHSYWRVRRARM